MVERIRNDSVSVGTSAVVVSLEQSKPNQRNFILITNTSTSAQKITLAFGAIAEAGKGIVLSPGGFHAEASDGTFYPTNEQITAISDGAGGTLAVSERILSRGDF